VLNRDQLRIAEITVYVDIRIFMPYMAPRNPQREGRRNREDRRTLDYVRERNALP
jgi:hypothetical protein